MNSDADDAGIGKLRDALNSAYDAYVKDYGPINKDGNGFLEDDIEFPTVAAIERLVSVPVTKTYKSGKRKGESYQVDEKRVAKADIFTKRTIFPFKEPTSAENIQDAIKISRIFRTGIDVGYIGNLLGMSPEAAVPNSSRRKPSSRTRKRGLSNRTTSTFPAMSARSWKWRKQAERTIQPTRKTWRRCGRSSRNVSASTPSTPASARRGFPPRSTRRL